MDERSLDYVGPKTWANMTRPSPAHLRRRDVQGTGQVRLGRLILAWLQGNG
jgi:hypothetical protein